MRIKILAIIIIAVSAVFPTDFYEADSLGMRRGGDGELTTNIEEIADKLDLTALEEFLSNLTEQQKAFLGGVSAKDFIKKKIGRAHV